METQNLDQEITTLKQQLKTKKTEARKQRKLARQAHREQSGSFWRRCETTLDNVTLTLCKPFQERAAQVVYKREDREGYEADAVIDDIEHIVSHFEKRAKRGRELKDKHVQVLVQLSTTLGVIEQQDLGRKVPIISVIDDRIYKLLPEKTQSIVKTIDKILDLPGKAPEELLQFAQNVRALTEAENRSTPA